MSVNIPASKGLADLTPLHRAVTHVVRPPVHACCAFCQVLERLKAATAYVQLAQSLSKPAKAAETKLARAAAKLSKTTTLEVLQGQLQAALEAAEQHCSTVKVGMHVCKRRCSPKHYALEIVLSKALDYADGT